MTLKLNLPSFFQHLIWLPMRIFMRVCCAAKVEGIEHVNQVRGNVIFASNHVTELDPLLIVASLPFFSNKLPIIYVVMEKRAYRELWGDWRRLLYGGHFFNIIGGYEAYRGLNDYKKALKNHLRALEKGQSVCIFPVGRRHTVDEIELARGGVSFLAKETGLPIIPVHIIGLRRDLSIKDYLLRRHRLRIIFGHPLYAKDIFNKPLGKIANSDQKAFEKASATLMKKVIEL